MSSTAWTLLGAAAVMMFWAIGAYTRLAALRSAIGAAWAQLEEAMSRRHEVLPAMVEALREPLHAEQPALDAVLAASQAASTAGAVVRSKPGEPTSVAALARAEQVLGGALARLRALLDQHAALRDEPAVARPLSELADLDQRLAFRRQVFNQAVHQHNVAVGEFPTRLLAPVFGIVPGGKL